LSTKKFNNCINISNINSKNKNISNDLIKSLNLHINISEKKPGYNNKSSSLFKANSARVPSLKLKKNMGSCKFNYISKYVKNKDEEDNVPNTERLHKNQIESSQKNSVYINLSTNKDFSSTKNTMTSNPLTAYEKKPKKKINKVNSVIINSTVKDLKLLNYSSVNPKEYKNSKNKFNLEPQNNINNNRMLIDLKQSKYISNNEKTNFYRFK